MDFFTKYATPPSSIEHPEYDERVKLAVESDDVGVITMTFIEMIKEGLAKDFCQFERDLRRLDLLVHLIAVPRALRPHGVGVKGLDGQDAPFSLWVCLHGRGEAVQKLLEIGVKSFDQNLLNLKQAGVLRIG
jgi:hypothetical protein